MPYKPKKRRQTTPPNRLKALRQAQGWSQIDVANYVGCSEPLVSLLENGRRRLTESTAADFAKLFNVSVASLFHTILPGGEIAELEDDEE